MRFHAWWEGYDVADMVAKLGHQQTETRIERLPESPENFLSVVKRVPWTKIRIQLTQLVWGEGYCGPGGPDNVIKMTKFLNLSSEKSIVVIGAGLGGPARTLVEKYGVWVDGYESSEALAQEGMKMSVSLGLEKKAQIIHKDLNNIYNISRSYDCFFSKEALFTVKNKPQLLKAIYDSLKPNGLFLFTDFILRDAICLQNPSVQEWVQQEPHKPYPFISENVVKELEQCGFSVRANEDITKDYLGLVARAWGNAEQLVKDLVEKGEDARESLKTVAKEAKFWERRKKIMNSGDLRVMRYLVLKKPQIK